MSDNNIVSQNGKSEEEELLNFEFDDLSLEDVDQANAEASPDEDVIELVDIVEKGEQVAEEPAEASPAAEMDSGLASDELVETVEASIPTDLEMELDAALDGLESSLELTEESQATEGVSTDDIESLLDKVDVIVEKGVTEETAAPRDVDSITAQLESLDVSDLKIDETGEIEPSSEEEGVSGKSDVDIEQEMTQRLEADLDSALETIEPSDLEIEEIGEMIEEEKPAEIEDFLEEEGLEEIPVAEQAPEETAPEGIESEIESALEGIEPSGIEIEEVEEMIEEEKPAEIEALLEEEEDVGELAAIDQAPEEAAPEGLESEIESALEELESLEVEAGEIAEEPELSLGEMAGEKVLETEVSEGLAPDLPATPESLELPSEEAGELELMESELEDVPDIGAIEGEELDLESAAMVEELDMESEGPSLEMPSESMAEISPEDLSQMPGISEAPIAEEVAIDERPAGERIGFSEEKLEALITKVVEEVVERVARETMVSVAEKVIKEAIEALKQSLEGPQE